MDKIQIKEYIDLIKSGLTPRQAFDKMNPANFTNIKALHLLRETLGIDKFRKLMHEHIMPNRICHQLEVSTKYIDNQKSKDTLVARVGQVMDGVI